VIEDLPDLAPIAAPLVTLAIGYLAGSLVYRRVKAAFDETVDLLTTIRDAWEDDTITEDEFGAMRRAGGPTRGHPQGGDDGEDRRGRWSTDGPDERRVARRAPSAASAPPKRHSRRSNSGSGG